MNLRPRRLVSVIGLVVTISTLASVPWVQASPIDDKKAQAKRLQDQIDANGDRMEVLAEQHNGAVIKLQDAQRSIAAAQARVQAAQTETSRLKGLLNGRAAALYKAAGSGGTSSTETPDVSDQSARTKYAAAAASKDNSTIDQLQRSQEELAVQQASFEAAKVAAQGEEDRIASSQQQLEKLNAQQEQLLQKTKGELANLIQQEIVRRKQEEDRRAAAERARRITAAQAARGGGGAGGSQRADAARNSATTAVRVPAPSAGAQAAVDFALAQVGKPYRYAATGPDAFDCSGLTMRAWAAGGISLPHYSGAQAAMFPRVPDDQIQPGDLVLYYGDLHHVAIAINGSQAVNAPHTGDFVKVQPIFRSAYRFAVRPG